MLFRVALAMIKYIQADLEKLPVDQGMVLLSSAGVVKEVDGDLFISLVRGIHLSESRLNRTLSETMFGR